MKKKALIFGVNGQDGSYLSRFLLKKNYTVFGVIRRSSNFNTQRIEDIYKNPHEKNSFKLIYGDVTDGLSVLQIIKKIRPDEIYNLAAQSHVKVSFEIPEYTAQVDGLGALRILEAIKSLNFKSTKFYQAGTSEIFGKSLPPQSEITKFQPQSPYAIAKLYAHWITVCYRESYNLFACNGILFNHESPVRGGTFVTKKIISSLIKIKNGKQKKLFLGNLYSKRDWGYAGDYVVAMWKMLQLRKPDDYVIATGKNYSVKEFVNIASKQMNMNLKWKGKGLNEVAIYKNKEIIKIDKKYFRPLEVESLRGNFLKAKKNLKWKPKTNLIKLIDKMIEFEKNEFKK
tara:strand:- start:1168 stop:2193 length:1026 start_codon:yes stop_codon:yes gene_type:complete